EHDTLQGPRLHLRAAMANRVPVANHRSWKISAIFVGPHPREMILHQQSRLNYLHIAGHARACGWWRRHDHRHEHSEQKQPAHRRTYQQGKKFHDCLLYAPMTPATLATFVIVALISCPTEPTVVCNAPESNILGSLKAM